MNETEVIEICRSAIITLIWVGGPSLVIMMLVGTTISIFQTVSQINEQTLAMVPKLLVVFATSILLMPHMLHEMRAYFEAEIVDRITAMGTPEATTGPAIGTAARPAGASPPAATAKPAPKPAAN